MLAIVSQTNVDLVNRWMDRIKRNASVDNEQEVTLLNITSSLKSEVSKTKSFVGENVTFKRQINFAKILNQVKVQIFRFFKL